MSKREAILETARSLLGTPFHHQGRVPGVGLDCVGLIAAIATANGYEINDRLDYPRQPYEDLLVDEIRRQPCLVEIRDRALRDADIVVMKMQRIHPSHTAIVDGDSIIHARSRPGRTVNKKELGRVERHRFLLPMKSKVTHVFRFFDL